VLVLLVVQAIAIVVFGVLQGYDLEHSLLEGSIVGFSAFFAASTLGNRTVRAIIASFGLISSSAIFTHLSGGYIEVHFHFFVMLAVISMYQQWPPFLLSILYVVVHHGLFGVLDPESVYNHPDAIAHPWKWAGIHAAFVSGACAAYVVAWKLSESAQARAQDILNSVGEGIIGLNANAQVIFVNPAAESLTMYREDEMIGGPIEELFLPMDGSDAVPAPAQAVISAPEAQTAVEAMIKRKDGELLPVEFSRSAMRRGAAGGVVIAFSDVSERKLAEEAQRQYAAELARLNEELARSNSELEQFAYVASHDLQEPLRKVQAFGDRLRAVAGPALTGDGDEYLERMQNAAKRMQVLISDLLAFSRVTTKTEPPVSVDLQSLVGEVLSDLEVRISELNADVQVSSLPAIQANRTQMRQLFQNLIGNALKFHKEGESPVVHVSAELRESGSNAHSEWSMTVKDNGIGFEQQYSDRIFGVFQRLHSRSEYEGTGIGLAVCKKIVELHGGDISVESSPGHGTTFTLTLPAVRELEEAA
jgi:PAS domain S-box-containing protein